MKKTKTTLSKPRSASTTKGAPSEAPPDHETPEELKAQLLDTEIMSIRTRVELLRQRRTSITLEASLLDQKLIPEAEQQLQVLLQKKGAAEEK